MAEVVNATFRQMRLRDLRKVATLSLALFSSLVAVQAAHNLFHPHETEKCEIVLALETSVLPAAPSLFTVALFAVDRVAKPQHHELAHFSQPAGYSRGPPA